MRTRAILTSLLVLACLAGGLSMPAQAADPVKFEGKLATPGPVGDAFALGAAEWNEVVCPDAGPADGTFYKFIDLKADYTNLKLEGPARLFTEPSGTLGLGDYDLDLYSFDAKCNALPTNNGLQSIERYDGKKPARFVLVQYYVGIHANLPFKLTASNSRIK